MLVGHVVRLALDARLTFDPARRGQGRRMFFFFSNRLGCLPSLLLSIAVTVVLLLLLGVL